MSELYYSLINESSFSSSISLSTNQYLIFIGPNCNKENDYLLESNKITTSKYQWYNFYPKILMEQFSNIANVYFLIISILQSIKEISYSNGSPIMLIPFSCIVLINGIKDIYEDWKRKKMNDLDNQRLCLVYDNNKNKYINKKWEDIKLGDIIKINKNEVIPCDMIILESSELNGISYVEPKNINGESNLYMKEVNSNWKKHLIDYSINNYICLTKKPNENLYKFNGNLYEIEYKIDKKGNPIINLERYKKDFYFNEKNFILRGMVLRQTNYIIGTAIYIGHNTKYIINSPKLKNKKSKLEKKMNKLVLFIFCFQICLSFISSIINLYQNQNKFGFINNFIEINNNQNLNDHKLLKFIKIIGTWIIIMTNFVPISLLTTFVFSKLCYGYFISKDIDMINKENMRGAKVHSSNLNEELGQVKYIFTDKTGTLTQNKMKFRCFTVGTNSFGDYNNIYINNIFNKTKKDKYGEIYDVDLIDENHRLKEDIFEKRNNIPKIVEHFFYNLCLCNDVHINNKKYEKNKIIEYISSSSDEKCLINFSRYCGYIFKNKSIDNIISIEKIKDNNNNIEVIEFNKCNILEFTSERKRMSVITQKKDDDENKYILYIKGSDNVIDNLLSSESKNSKEYNYIMNKVNEYSSKGLRTLLFGYKELSLEEYDKFDKSYKYLIEDMEENNNQQKIYNLYEEIENDITLIGATAIEDKLQYKAEETINKFINIGIKICMLTGDKLETAKNIAISCKLITSEMNIIKVEYNKILDNNPIKNLKNYLKYLIKNNFDNKDMNKKYSLLINGDILAKILSSEETIKIFNKLFNKCSSIICSRVSPKQKSKLVNIIKSKNKEVCLAIGDGANDVGMITESNIGIGINGIEGSEAARVSDYSLNQFFHLQKLLLYHGREAYRKNSYFIIYNFYKNIIFVSPMFFFGFINFFSGLTLYDPFLHQLYNVFYSIFPIFYFSIFDREYESKELLDNPNYYIQGMNNNCFNIFIFIKHLLLGFLDGFLLMISSFIVFCFNSDKGYNLNNLYSFGTAIFSGIIIIVNLKVLLNSKIIDIFIITLIFLSIFTYYIGVILFSGEKYYIYLHDYVSYNYYIVGDYSNIIKDNKFLLYVIFIIGLVIIIENFLIQIFNLINIKYKSKYNKRKKSLIIENENDERSEIIYNFQNQSIKESDNEEYEMQIINSSEDFE